MESTTHRGRYQCTEVKCIQKRKTQITGQKLHGHVHQWADEQSRNGRSDDSKC